MKKIIPIIEEIYLHISCVSGFRNVKTSDVPQIAPLAPKTSKINFTKATQKKLLLFILFS
jgi:hypothetical protein